MNETNHVVQGAVSAAPSGGAEESIRNFRSCGSKAVAGRFPDQYDEKLVDAADKLLRAALRGGTFRLAVQCDKCGAWVTAPTSVRRHRGPVCAKRAQQQEVDA